MQENNEKDSSTGQRKIRCKELVLCGYILFMMSPGAVAMT